MTTPAPIAVTTANIIIGPCTSFTVGGTSIGATSGGVAATKKQTFTDLSVDQVTGVVKKAIKEETYEVTTTMAEATLENLQIAWGIQAAPVVNTTPASKTLNLGVEKSVVEQPLVFVGPCPSGTYTSRTATFFRAISVASAKLENNKDKEQEYAVTFQCLPDLTKTAGQEYGTIVDA